MACLPQASLAASLSVIYSTQIEIRHYTYNHLFHNTQCVDNRSDTQHVILGLSGTAVASLANINPNLRCGTLAVTDNHSMSRVLRSTHDLHSHDI